LRWLDTNEVGYSAWDKSEPHWDLKYRKYDVVSKNNNSSFPKNVVEDDESITLINNKNNSKTIIDKDRYNIEQFMDWSPDYKYAIFATNNYKLNPSGYVGLDTDENNLNFIPVKVNNPSLGAGGEESVGTKWYFNKGFLTYCEQEIWFADGSEPIELTHSGGGGCHNQDGFVETSPNGENAFIKFDDRFEIHENITGKKQKVNEEFYIEKTRLNPYRFSWINDDYMLIVANEKWIEANRINNIFVFDRKNNEIKPVVKNASF
jgi:hypothetical protein